jgi:hypothetical protein
VTSMSMRLTISQTRKFIFGSIYVVLIFNSWHILLDTTSLSGCYLNKLMIVNNYPCSSNQMCVHNSPKHKLIYYLNSTSCSRCWLKQI